MNGDMRDAFKKAGYKGRPAQRAAAQFNLEENYTQRADRVIQELSQTTRGYRDFTTSKIRSILAMVSEIYNDVLNEQDEVLGPELQSRIEYLKVRLVYECGREPRVVKPFVTRAGLLDLLNGIGDSRDNFKKFSRYMEALVAYHRFHGGRD